MEPLFTDTIDAASARPTFKVVSEVAQPTPPAIHERVNARRGDAETSKAAARKPRSNTITAKIIEALEIGPATDNTIAGRIRDKYGIECSEAVHKRRPELCARGTVRFSGKWDKNASGELARVWELASGSGGRAA